jgi:hypothetical protein
MFVIMLFLFAATTAAAAGLRHDQAPPWMSPLARDPAEGEAPRALHLASRAFAVAVAAVTQVLVVPVVAEPQYGPLRFLLLGELAAAAAWLLYLRRLTRSG